MSPSKDDKWGFAGSPVLKTSPSTAEAVGLIPGQGVKIPHASWQKKKKKKAKQNVKKRSNIFKKLKNFKIMVHIKRKKIFFKSTLRLNTFSRFLEEI